MPFDERNLAERALKRRDVSTRDADADVWPPVSRRITEARLQKGLSETDAAARLDMTVASYWDLEQFDDEAFCVVSLAERQALGELLGVEPQLLRYGWPGNGLEEARDWRSDALSQDQAVRRRLKADTTWWWLLAERGASSTTSSVHTGF